MEGLLNFWNAVTIASSDSTTQELFAVIDQLSLQEKAALVEHLLNTSNMVVGFDSKRLSGSMIDQINQMDRAALGELLDAIAQRMAKENSRERG
jgi:hypothetical protein